MLRLILCSHLHIKTDIINISKFHTYWSDYIKYRQEHEYTEENVKKMLLKMIIHISDSQLEQMEKLKPLIRGVLYKFTEYKDAPDSMNFFRADVCWYFLLSFMCEHFENNEISQEYAISPFHKSFSCIKRLQVLKQFVKIRIYIRDIFFCG